MKRGWALEERTDDKVNFVGVRLSGALGRQRYTQTNSYEGVEDDTTATTAGMRDRLSSEDIRPRDARLCMGHSLPLLHLMNSTRHTNDSLQPTQTQGFDHTFKVSLRRPLYRVSRPTRHTSVDPQNQLKLLGLTCVHSHAVDQNAGKSHPHRVPCTHVKRTCPLLQTGSCSWRFTRIPTLPLSGDRVPFSFNLCWDTQGWLLSYKRGCIDAEDRLSLALLGLALLLCCLLCFQQCFELC